MLRRRSARSNQKVNVSNFEQITARWSCYSSFKAKGTVDDATAIAAVQALMMDRDRAVGSAKEIKGAVKEVVGKPSGTPSWSQTARPTR
jgi:hypothetical protein